MRDAPIGILLVGAASLAVASGVLGYVVLHEGDAEGVAEVEPLAVEVAEWAEPETPSRSPSSASGTETVDRGRPASRGEGDEERDGAAAGARALRPGSLPAGAREALARRMRDRLARLRASGREVPEEVQAAIENMAEPEGRAESDDVAFRSGAAPTDGPSDPVTLAVANDPFQPDRNPPAERYRPPWDRRPVRTRSEEPRELPDPPDFVVVGSAVWEDGGAALVRTEDGEPVLVRVGESVDGYRLSAVDAEGARLVGAAGDLLFPVTEAVRRGDDDDDDDRRRRRRRRGDDEEDELRRQLEQRTRMIRQLMERLGQRSGGAQFQGFRFNISVPRPGGGSAGGGTSDALWVPVPTPDGSEIRPWPGG